MPVMVTYKQFDSLVSSIFRANIKAHGRSLSRASMRAGDLVIDIWENDRAMYMVDTWRKDMGRLYLMPTETTKEK